MTGRPPETLIIGMVDGEWPVIAFTAERHALDWYETQMAKPKRRRARLWRVQLTEPVPLVIVPPVPARLVVEAEIVDTEEPSP